MTGPDVDPREFDRLLAALCDGELAPSEMARLNQLLRSTPAWRDRYILYMGIHATLHSTMGGGRAAEVADEGGAGRSPRIRLKPRGERPRWAAIGRLRRVGLAASAMVLLAAMGAIAGRWWMGRRALPGASTGGPTVARASRGAGVRFDPAGLAAGPDRSMRAGEYRLLEGILQVTFTRGAEVLIAAPAEFALLSEDRLLLKWGKLTARVPEPAKGFTVETPSATLIDLGTEFAADVDRAANGEVHVFRGEVIVQPRSQTDMRPVRLTGARATRIDGASATPSGIDVDATRFLRQFEEPATEYSRLAAAMVPRIYLDMTPTLDGHSLFDVPSSRAIGRVVPGPGHGTSWLPGRFGSSLRLRGPGYGDYALIPFRPEMVGETVSVVAWVLAESRPRWASILKRWGRREDHCFHFGLYLDDGDLEIHTAQADGREFIAREGRPLPTGRWQHVAFVVDRTTLRLYRNGAEVARADHPGLRPGALESIGVGAKLNVAGDGPDPIEPGFWDGRLDEIAIYPQALDAEQVRRLYLAAGAEGSRDPGGEGVASPGVRPTQPPGRPPRDLPLITPMSPPGRAGPGGAATPAPPESRALPSLSSTPLDEVVHEGP